MPPKLPPKPSHLTSLPHPTPTTQPSPHPSKRGLAFPWDHQPTHLFPFLTYIPHRISWIFNWELWVPSALTTLSPPSSSAGALEWIPCVRTAGQVKDIMPFLTDISQSQNRKITTLLTFNEPEIPDQANLSVADAVKLWHEFILPAKKKFECRVGAPGVSSDTGRCQPWLDQFFGALTKQQGGDGGGHGIDFLTLHYYGPTFSGMRSYLTAMHDRYNLPIWVNEFACTHMGDGEATKEEVMQFMREAVTWLEGCEWVERYAWFGMEGGVEERGGGVGTWVGGNNGFLEKDEEGGWRLSRAGELYCTL